MLPGLPYFTQLVRDRFFDTLDTAVNASFIPLRPMNLVSYSQLMRPQP